MGQSDTVTRYQKQKLSSPRGILLVTLVSVFFLVLQLGECEALFPPDQENRQALGNEQPVRLRSKRDGTWSEWSSWSPCSRTCGSGIRTQTRHCQIRKTKSKSTENFEDLSKYYRNVSSRHCEGHATRHHLCNTQECPEGTIDFRDSQCKSFDNRPFMGKVYQWESYMDERSPCSLTCRAKGYRFFATLNKSVIDGTPCTPPTQMDPHVCIAGVCTPIGCDGVAGSARRLDICGICGGDNSTCRLVSGIFTRPQLNMGFNLVAHIPKGACNINITEIKNTPNTLALRSLDGSFILNGDLRRPSWPGVYEGAGAKFQYTRSDVKHNLESISSAGPLKEPVDLLVVYQAMNPGIKYEYILTLSESQPIPPPMGPVGHGGMIPLQDTTRAGGGGVMAATSRPGSYVMPQQLARPPIEGGQQEGWPPPVKSLDNGKQHHHHHHGHHKRRSHRERGREGGQGRKFKWQVVSYTNCSETCGGGTQRSVIRCVREPHGNPVSDRRCEQEKPPIQTIRCSLNPCPAQWIVGEWGECSEQCGEGRKTRSIHCQQRISPTLTMRVKEGACLQRKPETETKCQVKSCHHWEASDWNECSARCGNGVRKRTVTCVDSSKKERLVQSTLCDPTEKPPELKPCNMGPCDMQADWFVSEWSGECSAKCGTGIQTRHVTCAGVVKGRNFSGSEEYSGSRESKELESNLIEDDDNENISKKKRSLLVNGGGEEQSGEQQIFCDENRKPQEERECFSDKVCNEAVWFTGSWGDCSAYCGKGVRTRQVLCIIFSRGKFKVVADSMCLKESRPVEQEICESTKVCPARWFATDWSECSAVCGGGTQKRSVSCRASNWTFPSTLCSDKDRPIERRSCHEQKCSLNTPSTSPTSSPASKIAGSSHTDDSGMVKDKPLQQQATGTLKPTASLPSPEEPSSSLALVSSSSSSRNSDRNSTSRSSRSGITATIFTGSNLGRKNSTIAAVDLNKRLGTSTPPSSTSFHERQEEHEELECKDEYRNCALVVQARLCRYKYYRSVCCHSCEEAVSRYQSN